MPKNKVQDAVFTAIMAIIMVYGMIAVSYTHLTLPTIA